MSRSYRKHPVSTDHESAKSSKKYANRRVRNLDIDTPSLNRASYKKLYEQYDIHDWKNRWTWEEALKWYHQNKEQYKEYPTEKEFYRYWYKQMKMK